MFQFTGFASLAGYHVFNMVGCPIRIPADHIVCADPRSFSQLITSFFASESLGIPHTPLFSLSPLPRILISLKVSLHTLLFNVNSCLYKSVALTPSSLRQQDSNYKPYPNMSMNVALTLLFALKGGKRTR